MRRTGSSRDHRIREIAYPLLAVAPSEARETLLSYLKDLEKTHEAEEKTSWMAEYVVAVEAAPILNGTVSALDVRAQLMILRGIEDKRDRRLPGSQRVMAALKTLGFTPTRTPSNTAAIISDPVLLSRLKNRFSTISGISGISGLSTRGPGESGESGGPPAPNGTVSASSLPYYGNSENRQP